jgi:hypothetical protein
MVFNNRAAVAGDFFDDLGQHVVPEWGGPYTGIA